MPKYIFAICKCFTEISSPHSSHSDSPAYNLYTFSTPWWAFQPGNASIAEQRLSHPTRCSFYLVVLHRMKPKQYFSLSLCLLLIYLQTQRPLKGLYLHGETANWINVIHNTIQKGSSDPKLKTPRVVLTAVHAFIWSICTIIDPITHLEIWDAPKGIAFKVKIRTLPGRCTIYGRERVKTG